MELKDLKREEKKYYLLPKTPKGFEWSNDSVLNYDTKDFCWFRGSEKECSSYKTTFTEKELLELGFKLSDFQYCEVGSDIWVYDTYLKEHSKTEFENILNEVELKNV